MNIPTFSQADVLILGAGPVGLAAAAHALARGLSPVVLEAGSAVAGSMREYAHVRLFSPWRYNVDKAAAALLEAQGWTAPEADGLPTAGEMVTRYLEPLAAVPEMAGRIVFGARVTAVAREGTGFVARWAGGEIRGRFVIDATGTWGTPNGLGAVGERENADRIFYGIPDVAGTMRERYWGRRVLVVGAGHSAANSLLALTGDVVWAVRGGEPRRVFGGGVKDALPARGELGTALREKERMGGLQLVTDFVVERVERVRETLTVSGGGRRIEGIDEIICATGQRPDLTMTAGLRLGLYPGLDSVAALGPLIDPAVHSCGTVRPHGHRELSHPEPGFYTAGVKSYGRAPTFLLATGYEQVRSITAALAGDLVAADAVELELPETGVCGFAPKGEACCEVKPVGGCCGQPAGACCG